MDEWQQRMELKIDRLSEAVIQLARIEERMSVVLSRMEAYERRQEKLDDRVSAIETTITERGPVIAAVSKIFWAVMGVLASYITWKMTNGS